MLRQFNSITIELNQVIIIITIMMYCCWWGEMMTAEDDDDVDVDVDAVDNARFWA